MEPFLTSLIKFLSVYKYTAEIIQALRLVVPSRIKSYLVVSSLVIWSLCQSQLSFDCCWDDKCLLTSTEGQICLVNRLGVSEFCHILDDPFRCNVDVIPDVLHMTRPEFFRISVACAFHVFTLNHFSCHTVASLDKFSHVCIMFAAMCRGR